MHEEQTEQEGKQEKTQSHAGVASVPLWKLGLLTSSVDKDFMIITVAFTVVIILALKQQSMKRTF